jgi:O-antigen biosynthesis protein
MGNRSRTKDALRSVLQWPVIGPGVTKAVGALGLASASAAPKLESVYRRLPITGGLAYGSTPEDQHKALLQYYARLKYRLSLDEYQPVISIVMPTFRPKHQYFWEALRSVGLQTYPHWELCVVDDASDDPEVSRMVAEFSDLHPGKVKFHARSENGHISRASNDALAMATGDYVALLDHDDRLYPHALAEVVLGLRTYRDEHDTLPLIMYTDERIIDEHGYPYGEVWRKPDWMPLLHLTSNYTNHLTLYQRQLIDRVGGFRLGFEGSQDHDLMLRATEAAAELGQEAVHIPALTYQWRSHGESVAKNPDVKSYSVQAAVRAVSEACERRGTPARIWREPGSVPNRIDFHIPTPTPTVALLMLPRGGDRRLCRDSMCSDSYPQLTVLPPVDSDLPDGVLMDEALRSCGAEYLAIVADDLISLRTDWIESMVRLAVQPEVGAVGGLVLDNDDRVISSGLLGAGAAGVAPAMAGVPFSERSYLAWPASIHEVLAVSDDAMMINVAKALAVGGFNTGMLAAQYSDVDICLRLREAGLDSVFTPYARFRTVTQREEVHQITPTERDTLVRTWAAQLTRDPYLNPGLVRSPAFRVDPRIWLPEVPPVLFQRWLADQRTN